MRKPFFLAVALIAAACNGDVAAPDASDVDFLLDGSAVLAYDAAGVSGPGRYLAGLHRLPENLRLTRAQAAAIKTAVDEFALATRADREALAAVLKQAHEAQRAGRSREEVGRILDQGAPIRARLEAAELALEARIGAILTVEQKAWLDANQPKRCDRQTAPQLTEQQRTQIAALIAAYELNNKADLEAVKAAFEQARAAQQNGASRERIRAILESAKPAMERLAAAQAELHKAIEALLTAEQKASGCFRGLLVGKQGR